MKIIKAIKEVGDAILGAFSKKHLVRTKIKGKDKISIRDFNHGEIGKIVGTVKKYKETIIAPISQRKCVYYQIVVQSKDNNNWTTMLNDYKVVDFLITEGEGTALIKAKHIQAHLLKDLQMKSGWMNDAPARVEKYLKSKNVSSKSFLGFNKSVRYFEGIIHLGEKIAVKGKGEWEMKPNPKEQMLIMKGEAGIELFISDDKTTF